MKHNPVVWFEIYVEDMKRARSFYEQVFDMTLEKLDMPSMEGGPEEMYAFPSKQSLLGAGGALVKMSGYPVGTAGTIIYFGSDDCAIEESRAEEHGGTVFRSKVALGQYGYMSLITDTEGNMIGIHSMQ